MRNNKLSVAVHIICLIEKFTKLGYEVNSSFIAGSVNTNPAAIRRIVRLLSKAGIVYADNGYHVNDFEQLRLYDIQQAVDSKGQLLYSHSNCNSECPVGSKIEGTMDSIYYSMQETVELEMKKILISSIMKNFE